MAKINVESGGAAPLSTGELQLNNGVAMSTTLTSVTDQNNTTSPLKLSTTGVQVASTLRITTDSNPYIDAEDGSTNNRFTVGRDPASQQVNVDFASNPAGSTTTVGAIRTYTDGVNLGEVVKFREDGQVTFTERVNVEADSLVTTQSSSVIAATTTNANLVIAPNGTGALVAQIPDGTATGGDARGANSIDLQTRRTLSNQVASAIGSSILGGTSNKVNTSGGNSNNSVIVAGNLNTIQGNNKAGVFIGAGSSNTIDGNASVIVGGNSNTSYANSTFIGGGDSNVANGTTSVVVGGSNNQSNANYTTVGGGQSNVASGSHNTISGGQSNTASTNTHATVVGGQSNSSSGQHSISGGNGNTASGARSIAFGESNTNSASYSFGIGFRTTGYLYGQFQSGSGFFAANSDAQQSLLTARNSAALTTGGTLVLSLDGTGTTNLIIPNGTNRMWNVQVRWVAVVTAITGTATGVTVGDTKVSTDLLAVAKRGGVTTVGAHTSAGTSVIETLAGSLTTANITYSAGASQEMAITFTGPTFAGGGSVTMRVVAAISLTEVAY